MADDGQTADPVADFLAREQGQLAELGDDAFAGSGQNFPTDDFSGDHIYGNVTTGTAEYEVSQAGGAEDPGSSSDVYGALKSVDKQRQEPEKIRKWREEQADRLAKKDAESEKKKAEWREVARRELEDWNRHREEQVDKAKKINRQGGGAPSAETGDSEDSFISDRDEKKPGGEWERICRLCDFNPKSSRANAKDVSRMRSILLQLKQTPVVSSGRQ